MNIFFFIYLRGGGLFEGSPNDAIKLCRCCIQRGDNVECDTMKMIVIS